MPSFRGGNSASLVLSAAVCTLAGCATVSGGRQYTSVDSEPHGVSLSLTKSAKGFVGRTPLFLSYPATTGKTFYALTGEDSSRKIDVSCRFEWETVLLGNLPVAAALGPAIGGIFFGAAVATDLFTEAAYKCPARVVFDLSATSLPAGVMQRQRGDTCRTILVMPPYQFKKRNSDFLVKLWLEGIRSQLKPCDKLLSGEEFESRLAEIDITFDKPIRLSGLDRQQLNKLGLDTGATHSAVIMLDESRGRLALTATLRDLHSLEAEHLKPVPLPPGSSNPVLSPVLQAFDQTIWVIPNSLQLSGIWVWPRFDQESADYKFFREDDDRDYLSWLSGWELGYVPRPTVSDPNTVRFTSSFALWSNLVQRRVNMYWKYSNVDPADKVFEFKDQMKIWYFGLTLENRLYFMNPILSPFIGAGAGVASVLTQVRNESFSVTSPYLQGYAGFLALAGENTFLEFSGGYAVTAEPHVDNPYTSMKDFFFARAKAGFYFSGLRHTVRRLF